MKRILNDQGMYQYFQDRAKDIFKELCGQEQPYVLMQFTADAISDISRSLQVFYSSEEAKEEICLIDNILQILNGYIGIEGMENLLINNYSSIENAIFLEHSSSGNPRMIREHYKHQFRNAYLGLEMLEDAGIDKSVETCILKEENEYACYIMDCIRGDIEEHIFEEIHIEKILKEIVYKSYFVAALFHDIGYPLAYYFRVSEEIQQFTPFFKIVSPTVKTPFSEIKALLNNSLLFRTVDAREIRKKYERNDHGCLSAISFLMNFYFSGSIYSLGKGEKNRCIVEMAAVAIYKHTDKYGNGKRMIFSQDPISYLVRICDDLQEWQRFMVLIEDTHNYLLCPNCGKIICAEEKDNREYGCGCGRRFRKITKLKNKKMNYVDTCDFLRLSVENTKSEKKIVIHFNYDYYSQIELLLNNYTGVVYREKGLRELGAMLQYQKYLPQIELQYFLSNNPIRLIQRMIEDSLKHDRIDEWLQSMEEGKRKENMQEFYRVYREKLPDSEKLYGKEIEKNSVRYAKGAKRFVRDYLGEIYQLWDFLYDKMDE